MTPKILSIKNAITFGTYDESAAVDGSLDKVLDDILCDCGEPCSDGDSICPACYRAYGPGSDDVGELPERWE